MSGYDIYYNYDLLIEDGNIRKLYNSMLKAYIKLQEEREKGRSNNKL